MFVEHGATPLFIAAHQGHLETCRELIERGASIDLPAKVLLTTFSIMALCHEAFGNPLQKFSEDARLNWSKIFVFVATQENGSRNIDDNKI